MMKKLISMAIASTMIVTSIAFSTMASAASVAVDFETDLGGFTAKDGSTVTRVARSDGTGYMMKIESPDAANDALNPPVAYNYLSPTISGSGIKISADINIHSWTKRTDLYNLVFFMNLRSESGWFFSNDTFRTRTDGTCGDASTWYNLDMTDKWFNFVVDINYIDKTYSVMLTDLGTNEIHNVLTDKALPTSDAAAATNLQQVQFALYQPGEMWVDNFSVTPHDVFAISAPSNGSVIDYGTGTATAVTPSDVTSVVFDVDGTEITATNSGTTYNASLASIGVGNHILTATATYSGGTVKSKAVSFRVKLEGKSDIIGNCTFTGFTGAAGGWDEITSYFPHAASGVYYDSNTSTYLTAATGPDGDGDTAIVLNGTSSDYPRLQIYPSGSTMSTPDRVILEMDTKLSANAVVSFEKVFTDDAVWIFGAGGNMRFGNVPYVLNTWKKLKIDFDYANSLAYVYYDGTYIGSTLTPKRIDSSGSNNNIKIEFQGQSADVTTLAIDNFHVYAPVEMPYVNQVNYIVGGSTYNSDATVNAAIPSGAASVILQTSGAVDATSTDAITLMQKDGSTWSTVGSTVGISGTAITITPVSGFTAGKTYKAVIGAAATASGVAYGADAETVFTAKATDQLAMTVSGNTYTATINAFSETDSAVSIIMAGYNSSGNTDQVTYSTYTLTPGMNTITKTFTKTTDSTISKVKTFCWNSMSEMKPVCTATTSE